LVGVDTFLAGLEQPCEQSGSKLQGASFDTLASKAEFPFHNSAFDDRSSPDPGIQSRGGPYVLCCHLPLNDKRQMPIELAGAGEPALG
jgi:hypothetical protein